MEKKVYSDEQEREERSRQRGKQQPVTPANGRCTLTRTYILDEQVRRAHSGKGTEDRSHGNNGCKCAVCIRPEGTGKQNEIGRLNDEAKTQGPIDRWATSRRQAAGLDAC